MNLVNQQGVLSILIIGLGIALFASASIGVFYLIKSKSSNFQNHPIATLAPVNSNSSVNQAKPLSSDTEKFMQQVAEGKAEAYRIQLEEAKKAGNWITYKNDQFGYEFRFPGSWAMPQVMAGDPDFHIFYANPNPQDNYYLDFKNANQLDNNSFNNYCEKNNDISRCEIVNLTFNKAVIDWGDGQTNKGVATIMHPTKKLQAVFEFNPVTDQSKKQFKEIISTFKFNSLP